MAPTIEHHTQKQLSSGTPSPLGATLSKEGVNFALFSHYAKEVFLLLFDKGGEEPTDVIKVDHQTDSIWHVSVHGIGAGQLYGYKVRGEYKPVEGKRFNEHKLLIDPYAKALTGKCLNTDNLLLAYDAGSEEKDLHMDERDSTPVVSKSVVIDDSFDWEDDQKPNIPLEDLIIYEVHLKGFTAHPASGVSHPGTYLGFIEKIPYLKELGINAVELLPIHEFHPRGMLLDKGLAEYWGYNTIGFFAPEQSYSTRSDAGSQVSEFKTLVRELHKAGIKVILDVVYNHTAEGNELGATLCFKGIDNSTYYALHGTEGEPYRYYLNDTGCGNTLNVENPVVMRLVIDSLHYWAEEMHVDGFRFDLASILARVKGNYSHDSAFFEAVSNDPVLSKVIMIAEPWDFTTYQVGNFPRGWSEWNGKFRDTVRKFIKGDEGQVGDLAKRLTGSSDLYQDDGRNPHNSINFITCHDGFTLNDLYSYNHKHNGANGEDNKDGVDDNHSWNCGVEGETEDANVVRLRKQMIKNALCALFFASGTPMLLYGNEIMRTQKGNNNAYCQDNDLTWFPWKQVSQNGDILAFCKKAMAFRKRYAVLRRRRFFEGKDMDADGVPDIAWFDKKASSPPPWDNPKLKTLCFQLDGSEGLETPSEIKDYHLFFIFHADHRGCTVHLPQHEGMQWSRVVDTARTPNDDFHLPGREKVLRNQERYHCGARCTVVLLSKPS